MPSTFDPFKHQQQMLKHHADLLRQTADEMILDDIKSKATCFITGTLCGVGNINDIKEIVSVFKGELYSSEKSFFKRFVQTQWLFNTTLVSSADQDRGLIEITAKMEIQENTYTRREVRSFKKAIDKLGKILTKKQVLSRVLIEIGSEGYEKQLP